MADKKNKGGRPQAQIDKDAFERLCRKGNSEEDVCYILQVTDKTLSAWCKRTYGVGFSEIYKTLSAELRDKVRKALLNKIFQEHDTTATIFGAKVLCGLRENPPDKEKRELELRILRAQAEAAEAGSPDPLAGKQVIIINDTKTDKTEQPDRRDGDQDQ